METLDFGAVKVEITPAKPVQLAGFSSRRGAMCQEADTPLFARIFCLMDRTSGQTVLIIAAELLNWEATLSDRLRARIGKRLGIPEQAVILHATHTHSGPATMRGVEIGEPDEEYLTELEAALEAGAVRVMETMEPVYAERGSGSCELTVNRRVERDGRFIIHQNEKGPKDWEVGVFRFRRSDGSTKALWMQYACHPVFSRENVISSEYCGYASAKLEREIGDGAVVAFFQGTAGDINPMGLEKKGGLQAVYEAGETFAGSVRRILQSAMKPIALGELRLERRMIALPFQRIHAKEELEQIANRHDPESLESKWARLLLQRGEQQASHLMELSALRLSPDAGLLFLSGEPVVQYGLYIKDVSGGTMLPVGYSNGCVGYVTTAAQLREGGYEPVESTKYFGFPSPYDPKIEAAILEGIRDLVSRA